MDELKNKNKTETETEEAVKSFNAYLEIYDEDELVSKVFGFFEGDPEELDDKALFEIRTFLLIKSGVLRSTISHTVFEILGDENDFHIVDYFNENDNEEGEE